MFLTMSSVGCPRCEESFRVPDAPLPEGIRLRCPWCNETFRLTELSHRLLPMVELIGEDNQPIELAAVMGATAVAASVSSQDGWNASERLPAYEPPSRLEPGVPDDDDFGMSDPMSNTEVVDPAQTITLDEVADLNQAAGVGSEGVGSEDVQSFDEPLEADEMNFDFDGDLEPVAVNTGVEPGFDSDQFEGIDPDDRDLDEYRESNDPISTQVVVDRIPVTGPMSPRPLSTTATRDFGDNLVNQRPRVKKKSSPIKTIAGTVLGGTAGVFLAGMFLQYIGKPLDLGFWPFKRTDSIDLTAAAPMDFSNRQPRSYSDEPGRSLAEDMAANSPISDPPPTDDLIASDVLTGAEEPAGDDAPAASIVGLDSLMTESAPTANDTPVPSVPPASDNAPAIDTPPAANNIPAVAEVPSSLEMPVANAESPLATEPDPFASAPTSSATDSVDMPAPEKLADLPSLPANATAGSSAPSPPAEPSLTEPSVAAPLEMPSLPPVVEAPVSTPPSVSFDPPASAPLLAAIRDAEEALKVVVEFPNPSDVRELNKRKANLYSAIAKTATYEQGMSQKEVRILMEQVASTGLEKDMTNAAPGWLRYGNRPNQGILVYGKVAKEGSGWILEWNGPVDLQLKGLNQESVKNGDAAVILGQIIDANPPAIIRVVHLEIQK
jgi:hypothetical protein